jgi:hypothetical protein
MTKIVHNGEDHTILLPRMDEAQSWEKLDELLAEINNDRAGRRSDLVLAHTAALFAGIESAPALDNWPIVPLSSDTSPRWVEMVVGTEIDRTILRILQNQDACVDCLIPWVRHMIESRITLSKWAWARDTDSFLS